MRLIEKSTLEQLPVHQDRWNHCSRFEVFLFKNGMHVKTVQVGWFAIKTIISSFKKVLKKCENLQKISLILLTESQFFWTFFALY